jgi:hypothetical protein
MTHFSDELNDPNAWLTVPEFDSVPLNNDFDGFDFHVFGPEKDRSLGESLIPIVGAARDLVKKHFLTIAELRKVESEVLNLVTVSGKTLEDSLVEQAINGMSDKQSAALLYVTIMSELSFVVWRSKDRTSSLQALALAAATLFQWLVHGPKEALKRTQGINRKNSMRPRPGTKSQMKHAIQIVMKPNKKDFHSFKTFIEAWEAGPINGLRLTQIGDTRTYIVSDENENIGQTEYTLGTLKAMYSQSDRI